MMRHEHRRAKAPSSPSHPMASLWERYRDNDLAKRRAFSAEELREHRETFFAGATGLVSLLEAPFRLAKHLEGAPPDVTNPRLLACWLGEILTELHAQNRWPDGSWGADGDGGCSA